MNIIEDKLTNFYWFQYILIPIFKKIKNFICFIIYYDFYVVTFWIHYMLFIIICGKNKVICYCYLNFPLSDFLGLFSNWQCFFSVTVTFRSNITVAPNVSFSYFFMIIFFFFILKRILNICKRSIYNWFSSFF